MTDSIYQNAQEIKRALINLYTKAGSLLKEPAFPKADSEFLNCLSNLQNETYDVVVCGEVKKGKSSFINAIIGENILPVDTKVATSQAFRIVNNDTRANFLVYTDGTKKEISDNELDSYGSQAKIDEDGELIEFNKIVDYIEIHTPIEFLPKSVVLVDTPGIGAIYANHATITERHLAKASAVIFITDPANPLTEPEIAFINRITNITSNILFVMTKQDNYDESYINTQITRNTEILVEKGIDKKLGNNQIKILPMSSTMLSDVKTADSDDKEIFYEISSFEAVKTQLNKLLVTTIALSRNVIAYNTLVAYNSRVMKVLADGNTILNSPDESKLLLTKKQQLKADFKTLWGPNGKERKGIQNEVNNILTSYSNRVQALFNPGSELYNKFLSEIDDLQDYDNAKSYAEFFPKRLSTEYMQAWQKLNEDCSAMIIEKLSKYSSQLKNDILSKNNSEIPVDAILPSYQVPKLGFMDFFNACRNGWTSVFFVSSMFIPLPAIVMFPISALIGLFSSKKTRLEKIKVELRNYFNSNIHSLRNQILLAPTDSNNPLSKSRFDSIKDSYNTLTQESLDKISKEQLAIIDEEINRIIEQISQSNTKRTELDNQLKFIQTSWSPIYEGLCNLKNRLSNLENIVSTTIA